jgi:hypothetical protein
MSREIKGRAGWHQATPKTSEYAFYYIVLTSCKKAVIANPALSNWLRGGVEITLANQGGLLNE